MAAITLIPYAEAAVNMKAFGDVVNPIVKYVFYPLIELMFGVALLVFVWGVAQLIIGSDDDSRARGKATIGWGTLGLFIMASAWGIVYLISNTVKAL